MQKGKNYHEILKELADQNSRSTQGVVIEHSWSSKQQSILEFCKVPHTLEDIAVHLNSNDRYYLKRKHINPMLGKSLFMTDPETPTSPKQKYYSKDT